MPSGLLTRRHFLVSMFAPAIAKPASKSPLPGICKPEFWFGEKVEFCWIDETCGKTHFERGEIVGASWNSPEAQWEYAVIWLNSTAAQSADEYPIFDGNFISADVLSRVSAK